MADVRQVKDEVSGASTAYVDAGDAATLAASEAYTDAAVTGLGTGDVHGPASSTDGHLAQFNGATGKIIEDGGLSSASFDAAGAAAAAIVIAESYTDTQIAGVNQYSDEKVDDRVAVLIQNGTGITWTYNDGVGTLTPTVTITQYTDALARAAVGGVTGLANPSASLGLVAVNGTATTSMRSDAAPALSQSIVPTWTGIHTFGNQLLLANGSAAAPELAFNTNYGLFYDTINVGLGFSIAGVQTAYLNGSGLILQSTAAQQFQVISDSSANGVFTRYTTANNFPNFNFRKAGGTQAVPLDVTQNTVAGAAIFQGYGGGDFRNTARIQAQIIEPTPSATAMGGRMTISCAPLGSITLTDTVRFEFDTGLSMYSGNVVIDQNRIFRPRSYTVATAPTVTATGLIVFSDEAGRAALGYTDGVSWRRVGDNQSASATVDYKGVWSNLSARVSSTLLNLIQSTYQKLTDAGLAGAGGKLLGLWVHAMPNQTDALLNWITPGTRNLAITGSPTFTANQGFTGDGATALLSTGASAATFGAAQNSAIYGVYVLAASAAAASVIGKASGTRNIYMQSASSGTITSRCNDTTNDTFTPARYTGLLAITRNLAASYVDYLDDLATSTITRTSTALSAGNICFLGTTDATGSEFSTAQISYSFIGTGMAAADVANLSSIMGEFLETVGAISYSVTHLPPAANFKNRAIYVSDLGGGAGSLRSDSTNWRRENGFGYEARTLATGSETLTPLTNATFVEYTQTLSGNVTVTLGATDAKGTAVAKGTWLTITHNNGTPGAFTFAIANGGGGGGTLITFASATNKSATCVFDGTNWRLMSDAAI